MDCKLDMADRDELSLVSVVIPAYNCCEYIGAAIDSALEQDYLNIEIIVVDDGSIDETSKVLEGYGTRITVVSQENSGVSAARNVGIEKSRGDIVAFLDADDKWEKEKISTQVKCFMEHPDVSLVYTNRSIVNNENYKIELPEVKSVQGEISRVDDFGPIFLTPFLQTSSVAVTKKVLKEVGGFDVRMGAAEDIDLYYRIAYVSPVVFINRKLVKVNIRQNSLSSTADTFMSHMGVMALFLSRNPEFKRNNGILVSKAFSILHANLGEKYLWNTQVKHAIQHLVISLAYARTRKSFLLLLKALTPYVWIKAFIIKH